MNIQTEPQPYFDFLADMGLTKHMGALNSTRELIEACQIEPGDAVLDVGCGVGVTACTLAKAYGCTVVGIDVTSRMIERAEERARREGVADAVQFRVADVLDLPFADAQFDVALAESVIVFVSDPPRAIREMARVTRPGGCVGLNEMTLLRTPPPAELLSYLVDTTGIPGATPTKGEWIALLQGAGLIEVAGSAHRLDVRAEAKSRIERWGWREMLRVLGRLARMYFRNPASRAFITRTLRGSKALTRDILDYLGYGVYVGRDSSPATWS